MAFRLLFDEGRFKYPRPMEEGHKNNGKKAFPAPFWPANRPFVIGVITPPRPYNQHNASHSAHPPPPVHVQRRRSGPRNRHLRRSRHRLGGSDKRRSVLLPPTEGAVVLRHRTWLSGFGDTASSTHRQARNTNAQRLGGIAAGWNEWQGPGGTSRRTARRRGWRRGWWGKRRRSRWWWRCSSAVPSRRDLGRRTHVGGLA